jgi:hypothetical protein
MKVPPPTVLLPFLGGLLVTFLVHPGGEPSSLRGALWVLLQLGLIAIPFTAGLNLLSKERRRDAPLTLSAWAGAVLMFLVLA